MNSTLLVATAIVGTLALLIYLLKLVTKKQAQARKKAMWESYRALLAQHNLAPDVIEEFPHRIFGLDTGRQRFVFVQHDAAQPHEVLDLTDQRECRVAKSGVSVASSDKEGRSKHEEHINSISLAFASRGGVRITVPVYTEVMDGIEQRQLLEAKASDWLQHLQQAMSPMKEVA